MKICIHCKQTKLTELFEIDRRKKFGRGSRCKECVKQLLNQSRKYNSPKRCIKCGMVGYKLCYGCTGAYL